MNKHNGADAPKTPRDYAFITLREKPDLADGAAAWFHEKWGVPKEAYLACMDAYLRGETEYEWVLCLDGEKIVMVVADEGPGIPNLDLAMQEGWSTASPQVREMGYVISCQAGY